MKQIQNFLREKDRSFYIALLVLIVLFASPFAAVGVTTISANISTDGTLSVNSTTASSTFAYSLVVDTTTLVVNANENRLGVGTAAPTTTLGVLGNSRFNGTITGTGNFSITGGTATFYPNTNAASIFDIQNASQASVLSVSTNGTVASTTLASSLIVDTNTFIVNANENQVGIGTAAPSTTLSVVGATRLNGNLTATGSLTFGEGTAITRHVSATASLDFPNLEAGKCNNLTMTVTGAADGDTAVLGIPDALGSVASSTARVWVSAADTATVQICRFLGATATDPGAATVRVDVWKH